MKILLMKITMVEVVIITIMVIVAVVVIIILVGVAVDAIGKYTFTGQGRTCPLQFYNNILNIIERIHYI